MDIGGDIKARVLENIRRDRLVELTRALVDIPSPTGHEAEVARFLVERMHEIGLKARLQEISEGRYNAIGELPGRGGGLNLLFNGHIDTSYSGRETVLSGSGYKTESRIVDDAWIYGAGVNNMKSAIAGYLEAVRAIVEAGIDLPGSITIAGVAGEIETGPVDEFQGCDYAGHGIGTLHLIRHGLAADCCILGEPTAFQVTPWHFGTVWVAFRARGTMAHTAWLDRAVNAVDESMTIYNALKDWIVGYRARNVHDGIMPNVNVSAIRGGWPWRVSRVPVYCDLFMDVRLNPRMSVVALKEELEAFLRELREANPRLDAELEFYGSGPGTEIGVEEAVVQAVVQAHEAVMGTPPKVAGVNFYSDAAHLNRYGVPTVNYGLSGRLRTGGEGFDPAEGEHQSIEDLVLGTQAYALAALAIAGKSRDGSAA